MMRATMHVSFALGTLAVLAMVALAVLGDEDTRPLRWLLIAVVGATYGYLWALQRSEERRQEQHLEP